MADALRTSTRWVRFAGCVLAIAVLHWAQAVFVPVALATLLTFVLAPVVTLLQRHVGRIPAVLGTVVLTFTLLGFGGWVLTTQLTALVQDLPHYQQHVREKIRDIRWLGRSRGVETLQETVRNLQTELEAGAQREAAKPLIVEAKDASGSWPLPITVSGGLESLATSGLVVVLVIFMLLERQELRDRLLGLFGHGRLAVTTKAFDEAGWRISRYLFVQSLINLSFGVGIALGLTIIGLPYVLLWAVLAGVLRFIPYVGPWIGAASPVLLSLAVFGDWTRPFCVLGLFLLLELFTNLVLENIFYAGAAGVSQTGLIVAVAFWTWLWGPLGLLLATPLTVCLVVVGKYVPGFEFVTVLIGDKPPLGADVRFYQRLLAGDHDEASELLEEYVKAGAAETAYDALMIPALNYAERDRIEGRLSPDEEQGVVDALRELLGEIAPATALASTVGDTPDGATAERIALVALPAHGAGDVLALQMFANVMAGLPFAVEVLPRPPLASDLVALVREHGCRAVCVVDLPPSAASRARYLIRRVRAGAAGVRVVAGRWSAPALADDAAGALLAAGADAVQTTMLETREQLCRMFAISTQAPAAAPEAGVSAPVPGRVVG
jgi:predicted PurR-regulated permease PerM